MLTSRGSVEANHPNVTQFSIMEKWDWNEAARLAQCIKRSKPNAVLIYYVNHLYHEHPMITFTPTIVHTLIPAASIVTIFANVQGCPPSKFGFNSKLIHKVIRTSLGKNVHYGLGTLLRNSSQIVVMSRVHLQQLIGALPQVSEKSTLIPPPAIMMLSADTEEVRESGRKQLSVTENMFLFAYFGYLYPGKGVETLIRAFSLVAAQNDSVRLAIIGSVLQYIGGPEYAEKVRQLVTDLELEKKIVFTGEFDWDSPQGSIYLRAADVCVLPFNAGVQMNNSSFAGAVTHGLPVVTTSGLTLEEPFLDGENVFLCPPEDPEAMAAAMLRVMDDAALRNRLQQGALRFADEWFSWKSATRRTLAALGAAV